MGAQRFIFALSTGVALLFLTAGSATAQETPYALLTTVLHAMPGVHLLEPRFLDPEQGTLAQLKRDHIWHPWFVGDVDRDGLKDVVAVVVKPTSKGLLYGVVAVHAAEPDRIHWVIPMDKAAINGVQIDDGGFVTPYYCVYCDANPWYNWTGSAYRDEIFGVGQVLSIGEDIPGDDTLIDLASRAINGSGVVGRVKGGTRGTVIAIRGTDIVSR